MIPWFQLSYIKLQFPSFRWISGIFQQDLERFKAEIAFIHMGLTGGFRNIQLDFDFRTVIFLGQEPITESLQLPHNPVVAFSQTDLFLAWIYLEFRFPQEP